MFVRTERPKTWLGRPGVPTTYARSANAATKAGERVSAIRWEDGTVSAKHLTGDGRLSSCVVHDEQTFPAGTTDEQVRAYAAARLGEEPPL